ncbi:NAD(P)/FAD-dependent oxidoreductase [bacterium]|nr:NAD(P)/FAD-dependent oxidoreductase [bacterium]
MSKKKIAVVGAGIAGLVAALELNKVGMQVSVFEKSSAPGGRAKTTNRDSFNLNLGPHALYNLGSLNKYLTATGIELSGNYPATKRSAAIYGGKVVDLPVDVKHLLRTKYLNVFEKLEYAKFFGEVAKIDTEKLMNTTITDWLNSQFKSKKVQQTVEAFIRLSTYGNNPDIFSAGAGLKQLQLALNGVRYLDGGWQKITEALSKKLSSNVKMHFDSAVTSLNSSAQGVALTVNGNEEFFDAVILCVPPNVVNSLIPGIVLDAVPSYASCLDVCLKKLPNPEATFALGIDEPLYLSVHSAAANLGPAGSAMIHVAYYCGSNQTEPSHEAHLEKMLDQLQPGWRNELVFKRFLPHMAASFGTPLAKLSGSPGLESPNLQGVENVYVCGDFVGKGYQLVDCATQSALDACKFLDQNQY